MAVNKQADIYILKKAKLKLHYVTMFALAIFCTGMNVPANAADITIINGQTETTKQASTAAGDTISILAGGTVATTTTATPALQAINFANVTLSNAGTITTTGTNSKGMEALTANASGAIINNSGSISVTNSSSDGIATFLADNVTITNTGTISATGAAINAINISSISDNVTINLNSGSNITGRILIASTNGSLIIRDNAIINGNIDSKSAITFNQSTQSGSYGGIISNTASVTKTGTNSMVLTGANTYSGGTTVNGGTLTLQGGSAIVNSGSVNITSGTLDIDTAETIGSLSGSGTVNLDAGLTVGDTTNKSYSGVIQGSGSLTKQGTGTLILTGTNTYTGTTTINAGTLAVNGSIASSTTTVNNGSTLGGTGTVGNVTINNGGTFAPGNSIGTTNVTGNVVFTAGSNYNVEVNAAGQNDKIVATGSATLNGTVNVQPESGNYNASTDYTILTATGGLTGTFASVNSNLAFLTPTLSYVGNDVKVNLTRNNVSYSSVVNTLNQLAVSTVLSNNTTVLQIINNNILVLTNSGARQAFDSLSGIQHTQGSVVINNLSQQFQKLLCNHSTKSANGSLAFNNFNPMQGNLLADNSNNWQNVDTDTSSLLSQRGWWIQGFGGFGSIDDTTNASGADYQSGGFAFGVDTDWHDFVVGFAGSYAHTNVDPFAGDSDIDSFQAGAYGSWERDGIYMNANAGLGLHKVDATRTVTVGMSVNTANSDYDNITVSSAVEVGKDMKLDIDTTLTPYVGVTYAHNNRDDFTETGAGTANLSASEQDDDSLRTTIGLRLSRDIKTNHNKTITPSAMIAYVHEHMDNVSRLEAGFSAVPTSTFRIDDSDLDRDRLQLGVGVSGQLNENTTLNVGYTGELADSDDHHAFTATVSFVW